LLAHLALKDSAGLFCQFHRGGAVDLLKIGSHNLAFFPGDELQRVSDHVHDAQLDLGLGEDGLMAGDTSF